MHGVGGLPKNQPATRGGDGSSESLSSDSFSNKVSI